MSDIGRNIKTMRESKGLKQSELAEKLGISDKTVSSWEINRTEPKMGMIEKMCSILNCSKTDIVGCDMDYIVNPGTADQIIIEIKKMDSTKLERLLDYAKLLNNQK